MQNFLVARKLKEIGKKYLEVLIELLPVAVLDKAELESRVAGVRANLVSAQKRLEEAREIMKRSQDITQEFKSFEQTDEFQAN